MTLVRRILGGTTAALLLSALLVPSSPPAQASQDPEDWRLLFADGSLRDGTRTPWSNVPVNISADQPTGRFSPDGTLLAVPEIECLDARCDSVRGSVRVHHADGGSDVLAWVPDLASQSVTWSPDGTKVAVMGRVFDPEDPDIRIYVLPLDGTPATLTHSDDQLLQISLYDGISWNPVDDRLAFIATEYAYTDGQLWSVPGGTDQVWTVPAGGSAFPTRYSGTPTCGDCSRTPSYFEPTWSPDGSRLVVGSEIRDPFSPPEPGFTGYLAPGALAAVELTAHTPRHQIAWSHDGERLAYGIEDTSGDFYDETVVVDADSGAVLTTVRGLAASFTDWLPCPSGSCPDWQVPAPPRLDMTATVQGGRIVVSGEVFRAPALASVTLTLHKRVRVGAPWRRVTTTRVDVVDGLFTRRFTQPNAVQCRVRGLYVDGTQAANDSVVFRC